VLSGLDRFAGGAGFAAIRAEWLDFAAGLDEAIRIDTPAGRLEGIFRTIDGSGRLVLDGPDGTKYVEAGDVWLTDAALGSGR
jgi:BirA family biotin operon repressor/biotin-[acetyl-CoA-carboxylase] ligase